MNKLQECCDDAPKTGDVFVCQDCGMTLTLLKDCGCADASCVSLACCGKAMEKVTK